MTSYVAVLTSVMVEVETSTCRTVEYSVVVSVLTSAVGQSVVMQVAPLQMVVGVSVTCAAAFLFESYEITDFIFQCYSLCFKLTRQERRVVALRRTCCVVCDDVEASTSWMGKQSKKPGSDGEERYLNRNSVGTIDHFAHRAYSRSRHVKAFILCIQPHPSRSRVVRDFANWPLQ